VLFVLANYVTSAVTAYIVKWPESGCVTIPASEISSEDRAYRVLLWEKSCAGGESVRYQIEIHGLALPPIEQWYTVRDIESDEALPRPPSLHWATPRRLNVDVQTENLSGVLEDHLHDLVLIRTFSAARSIR
jgi:hypothetical protein